MKPKGRPKPPRWIDLQIAWPLQYAGETIDLDADDYPGMAGRLDQVAGYLGATAAAFVSCERSAADWSRRADPWAALSGLIARVEAEFPGRVLIGPEDFARWTADPAGLPWAVLGVGDFDVWLREDADLGRLAALFDRGVRRFRPFAAAAGRDPERGLDERDRRHLDAIDDLGRRANRGRPLLDLGGLGPPALAGALDWLEAADRAVVSMLAPAGIGPPGRGGIAPGSLARLRAIGATIGLGLGPAYVDSADDLKAAIEALAAIPFQGRAGVEGIALASSFLGQDAATPGLADAEAVAGWVAANFEPEATRRLLADNGRELIGRGLKEELSADDADGRR